MAGPSIVVRVLGDLKGLGDAFNTAGSTAASAAGRAHGAFSSMLGTLNASGVLGPFGQSLSTVDQALTNVEKHGATIGKVMLGVGGALTGVGMGLQALGSKDQAAHQQLQAAVEATGHSYDDYAKQVDAAVKHQENFGHTANQTQDALRILTQATGDPTKAFNLLSTAANLAAAKHEDLGTAATAVGKVYNGNTKILKEFGVTADTSSKQIASGLTVAVKGAAAADSAAAAAKKHLADLVAIDHGKAHLTVADQIALRDAQAKVITTTANARDAHIRLTTAQANAAKAAGDHGKALDTLGQKLGGQAQAQADTFSGKLAGLKAKVEDSAAAFGQKYGPAISAAGVAMMALGSIFETMPAILGAMSAAWDALGLAELIGLGPILLIVAGVAALIAVGYLLYANWNTVWGFIKAIVSDVWNWIAKNWPLLLGILLGPIALAAALIYQHWTDIWNGIKAVWNWIASTWNAVYGFLRQPVESAVNWIAGAWNGLYNTFSGVVHRLGGLFSGMWDGIWQAFRGTINAVINGWNSLHFTMPTVDTHIPGIGKVGGFGVGVGHITPLATGGLITRTGLFYGHAGEAVTPAPAPGPAVIVQHAHFETELDLEAFMRRAAWAVRVRNV